MTNDFEAIEDLLEKSAGNFGRVKQGLAKQLDEIGYQAEVTLAQKKLWHDLGKIDNVPSSVHISGVSAAKDIHQQSERLKNQFQNTNMKNTLKDIDSISESMSGTLVSGATISYPSNQLPASYYEHEKILEQRSRHGDISQRLRVIDPSLADEYDNAWKDLYRSRVDRTRGPMFLIREVITRLYHQFAPDDKVIKLHGLDSKEKITRRHRVKYIASKLDHPKRKIFFDQENAFVNIYRELSKAHKHGMLEHKNTKGILHQANGLIRLLLDSLDTASVD